MSNISRLQGTPFHIGYIKSDESGRRDRRGCIFFVTGNTCSKGGACMGGRYCLEFERKEKPEAKVKRNVVDAPIVKNKKIRVNFAIRFLDDDEIITKRIGENIDEKAELVNIVANVQIGDEFEINGEKGIVINKNIAISYE